MSETVSGLAFTLLAIAAVGGALGVMLERNVVRAAFWLLGVMLSLAGFYLLLAAEFLALVQVLVYAGAVSVLLLFVVMLTLRRKEDAIRPRDASLPGAVLAAAFLGVVVTGLSRFGSPVGSMPAETPGIAELGKEMFTRWALPFEIASLVLLVALIAAVWWSGEGED